MGIVNERGMKQITVEESDVDIVVKQKREAWLTLSVCLWQTLLYWFVDFPLKWDFSQISLYIIYRAGR